MLDFLAILWSFVWALITNWIFYMTAFPLIVDDLIKWCSPKSSAWIEERLSGARRRKVEIYFIFAGFFVASFMAFDEEHEARTKAEVDNQTLAKQLAALSPNGQLEEIKELQTKMEKEQVAFAEVEVRQQQAIDGLNKASEGLQPRNITEEQRRVFIDALKNVPKGPVVVITFTSSSAEVTNFANQVRSLLDDAGYGDSDKPKVVENMFASMGGGTIQSSCLAVKSRDPKDLPEYTNAIQAAFKSLSIPADGIADDKNVLGLKDKEIGIIIEAR